MRGLQNIKLNKGWLCNILLHILVKGGVKYRNLQNLIIIYIVFGFTCNNNNNNNNNCFFLVNAYVYATVFLRCGIT